MLAFMLLAARDGAPIAQSELAMASTSALAHLPFIPESTLAWSNRTGATAVLAWQALTGNAGLGSHWHVGPEGGLTLFSGHCWPRVEGWNHASGESWANQLATWLERNPIETAHEHLFGLYSILRLDPDGEGMAVTDLLGGAPLYTGESLRWLVLANRSGLAAAAAVGFTKPPERDPLAMGWLVFWDSPIADDSGYWDATRLPFNAQVAFGTGGSTRIETRPYPFWHRPGPNPTRGNYDDLLEEVDADLRAELRSIAKLPVDDWELRLSGGKDSRMLAALLHDEGLADRFRFLTYGVPGQADVQSAELVAQRLGLHWSFENRSGVSNDREERQLLRHTFLVEGATSGWDTTGMATTPKGISLSGIGGECTIFGRTSTAGVSATRVEEVKALYAAKDNFDQFKLLTPAARMYYRRVIDDWIDRESASGQEPNRIPSLFYTRQRTRCWAGPSLAVKPSLWLGPYLIPSYIRFRQLLPITDRANPRVHLDMLRRCRVDVATIPLAGERWPEGAIARYPDADRLRVIQPMRDLPGALPGWRAGTFEVLRPMLANYLGDRSNPIFALVDYDAVQRLLNRTSIDGARLRNLYGAATAAIWLSGRERPIRLNRPSED